MYSTLAGIDQRRCDWQSKVDEDRVGQFIISSDVLSLYYKSSNIIAECLYSVSMKTQKDYSIHDPIHIKAF